MAPAWDQYANLKDVQRCLNEVRKVYGLYNSNQNLNILMPEDYNRFPPALQQEVIQWLVKQ